MNSNPINSMAKRNFLVKSLIWPLMIFILASCSAVSPWERGNLAKSRMSLNPLPMQTNLRLHIYGSREAAAAINVGGGGGCGCF